MGSKLLNFGGRVERRGRFSLNVATFFCCGTERASVKLNKSGDAECDHSN